MEAGATVPVDHEVTRTYCPLFPSQTKLGIDVYATYSRKPIYVDDPGSQKIGSITVDLEDVMHLSLDKRELRVSMRFGDTQTRVKATLAHTGEAREAMVEFNAL